jgi:hypothetical protein
MNPPRTVYNTDYDSEEEYYRCRTNVQNIIYSPRDIRVVGIHGRLSKELKVMILFRFGPRTKFGHSRTATYPMEQAQALFEDVLARHVHECSDWYPVSKYPEFKKYHNYVKGQYPVSKFLVQHYK